MANFNSTLSTVLLGASIWTSTLPCFATMPEAQNTDLSSHPRVQEVLTRLKDEVPTEVIGIFRGEMAANLKGILKTKASSKAMGSLERQAQLDVQRLGSILKRYQQQVRKNFQDAALLQNLSSKKTELEKTLKDLTAKSNAASGSARALVLRKIDVESKLAIQQITHSLRQKTARLSTTDYSNYEIPLLEALDGILQTEFELVYSNSTSQGMGLKHLEAQGGDPNKRAKMQNEVWKKEEITLGNLLKVLDEEENPPLPQDNGEPKMPNPFLPEQTAPIALPPAEPVS